MRRCRGGPGGRPGAHHRAFTPVCDGLWGAPTHWITRQVARNRRRLTLWPQSAIPGPHREGTEMQRRRPVMLVILDGFGWREEAADNAVRQAKTPTFRRLWETGPHGFLHTSGHDVGLPDGQMGNSEVGHLNIGAGRVVMQDLPRISDAIAKGEIKSAPALTDLIRKLKAKRRHLPSHRPGVARRRAFASGSRRGARRDPHRSRRADAHARHHRRSRHAAAVRGRISRSSARGAAAIGRDRDRVRPLLRHGSRQALGAGGEGLQRDRRSARPALSRCAGGHRGCLCEQAIRRVHPAGGGGRLSRHAGRRRRALLQLPGRPRARDSRRHPGAGFLRLCAPARRSRWRPRSA